MYHAHVYFNGQNKALARALCDEAAQQLQLQVGRFHEKLVGPHPMWSCQIIFSHAEFDLVVPWLEQKRQGLTVLVHGLTGDDIRDHTEFAYWLGESKPLNMSVFEARKSGLDD